MSYLKGVIMCRVVGEVVLREVCDEAVHRVIASGPAS